MNAIQYPKEIPVREEPSKNIPLKDPDEDNLLRTTSLIINLQEGRITEKHVINSKKRRSLIDKKRFLFNGHSPNLLKKYFSYRPQW